MWFTEFWSVAGTATIGVGVGDRPPAETPPLPQAESESRTTEETRAQNTFRIKDPINLGNSMCIPELRVVPNSCWIGYLSVSLSFSQRNEIKFVKR